MTIDLNLRKIRGFTIVAELGSFRRAAEKMHISASALSVHVRELEEAVGVPLLFRTTRSVKLTADGIRFLARTRQLLAGLDEIVEELKDEADLMRGRITVACVPTLVSSVLPLTMVKFKERFPGISVRVMDIGSPDIAACLERGDADLGIGPPPENSGDFEVEPLVEDPFLAVVPAGHALAKRRTVHFAELADFPFIGLKIGTSVRRALERAAAEIGLELVPTYELVYHYSVGCMVQAGLGITALPSMALPLLNLPGLISIPIVSPRITRMIGIIRRKGGGVSPSSREFLSVLSETIGQAGNIAVAAAKHKRLRAHA